MGIDVDHAKVVTFNGTHEHRVVTDPARPFPIDQIGDLRISSIFQRRTTRLDNHDGNPLIYALKSKFGYTIPNVDLKEILSRAREILPHALADVPFDVVVPLPSSSPVAMRLGVRASRLSGGCLVLTCLDKATVAHVLAAAPPVGHVAKRMRNAYTTALANMQLRPGAALFEMKFVRSPIRHYFVPVVTNHLAVQCAGRRVLLVDDILGSGTSLKVAEAELRAAGAMDVSALTLLSRLR